MNIDIPQYKPDLSLQPQNYDSIAPGFTGIPQAEAETTSRSTLVLYQNPALQGVGLHSFTDSATVGEVVGQMFDQYNQTVPMDLVTQQEMFIVKSIENPQLGRHFENVRNKILQAGNKGALRTTGGEDLSFILSGKPDVQSFMANMDGPKNPGRDLLLLTMYSAALESGAYISGTCKNFQALLRVLGMSINHPEGLVLQELGFTHRKDEPKPKDRFTYTSVASLISDEEIETPLQITHTYCNHHEGIRLADPAWHVITEETGWRPYHASTIKGRITDESVVESVVKLGPNGEVLGMVKQYHDEKDLSDEGEASREWDKLALERHWQRIMTS